VFLIGILRQLREQAAFTRADACRIFNKQVKAGLPVAICGPTSSQWSDLTHVTAETARARWVNRSTENLISTFSMSCTRYLV
jgi:hypothetical protein